MNSIRQNLQAILFVFTIPVVLILCFKQDQLGLDKVERSPAVESRNK